MSMLPQHVKPIQAVTSRYFPALCNSRYGPLICVLQYITTILSLRNLFKPVHVLGITIHIFLTDPKCHSSFLLMIKSRFSVFYAYKENHLCIPLTAD